MQPLPALPTDVNAIGLAGTADVTCPLPALQNANTKTSRFLPQRPGTYAAQVSGTLHGGFFEQALQQKYGYCKPY